MSNKIGANIATLLKLNETIHNLIYCLHKENCSFRKQKCLLKTNF